MKALQLTAVGQLDEVDIPVPAPGADEVLVRTRAGVVCTSDLNDLRENPFGIALPVIMGHEGAGTVERVGPAVRGIRAGDRVAAHPVHPCGTCENCREGLAHHCGNFRHFAFNMPGVFAERFVARADRVRKLPGGVSFETGALLEPVCVCLEALAQANLTDGGRLLTIGDGPFGVLIARLALGRLLSANVLAGHHDFRLGFAAPARTVNIRGAASAEDALRAAARGGRYDAVIIAVGRPAAIELGLRLLRPKGRLVMFSAIPGLTPVNLLDVHFREIEVVGACNDDNRLDEAVRALADPGLAVGRVVTHRFPFSQHAEAFRLADSGHDRAMKVALTFPEAP
jgi:threonine dehydrogenase-like Zn-dependent dehydrogenase